MIHPTFEMMPAHAEPFEATAARLRACRLCRDAPLFGAPLPHEPRPVVQGSATARLLIASQAPGNRAHRSGIPFSDPSGRRLRAWLGLDEAAITGGSSPICLCKPCHM